MISDVMRSPLTPDEETTQGTETSVDTLSLKNSGVVEEL
jgi:hypothetical protein